MFTPAAQQYFLPRRFTPELLTFGDEFCVPSGMGGSWTIRFFGRDGDYLVFKQAPTHRDYALSNPYFRYPIGTAHCHLYILVAADSYLRSFEKPHAFAHFFGRLEL